LIRSLDVTGQVTFVLVAGMGEVDHAVHLTALEGHEVTGRDVNRTALRELVLLKPVRWLGHEPGVHAAVNAWFGR
jgi:hypothetical protein